MAVVGLVVGVGGGGFGGGLRWVWRGLDVVGAEGVSEFVERIGGEFFGKQVEAVRHFSCRCALQSSQTGFYERYFFFSMTGCTGHLTGSRT